MFSAVRGCSGMRRAALRGSRNRVTNQAVEQVVLSRAWVLGRLMRHAQVCLGEIPLRLKMRKAHSADVVELETHQPDASAANRAHELLGRELNLFTEKKEVGKPGEFDHMAEPGSRRATTRPAGTSGFHQRSRRS